MSQAISVNVENGRDRIIVSGELTYTTVKSAMSAVPQLMENLPRAEVDLSDITRSDSAGLALLIHWMRAAQKVNKPLSFSHIPAQMLAIASASGLDELLPVSAN